MNSIIITLVLFRSRFGVYRNCSDSNVVFIALFMNSFPADRKINLLVSHFASIPLTTPSKATPWSPKYSRNTIIRPASGIVAHTHANTERTRVARSGKIMTPERGRTACQPGGKQFSYHHASVLTRMIENFPHYADKVLSARTRGN